MVRIFLFIIIATSFGPSTWASPVDVFHKGIEAYRAKKWDEAHGLFSQVVQEEPHSSVGHFNLGLTELQKGKVGLALTRFRTALYLDSGFDQAQAAIGELSKKVDRPFQAREVSTFEIFRNYVLVTHSTNLFILLTAALLAASGFLALRYLQMRKRAEDEGISTGFPTSLIIVGALTLVAIATNVAKIVDRSTSRVTVTETKTSLFVGPGEDAVSLLEIPEGNELVVQNARNDDSGIWLQVTLPGSLTGWVPAKSVTRSAGPQSW